MATDYTLTKPDWTPGPLGRDASELARISASPKGWIYTGADSRVEVLVALRQLDGKQTDLTDAGTLPTFTAALTDDGVGTPALVTGDTLTITLTASEAVNVAGTPYVVVTLGSGTVNAAYVSGSGTTSLVFEYTFTANDAALATEVSVAAAVSFGTYDGIGDLLTGTGGTNWLTAVTYAAPDASAYSVN